MAEREESPRIYLNVPVSEKEERRILREERFWTGRKLSVYCVLFLGLCLLTLFIMASTTSETTWGDWLFPWPTKTPF